MDKVTVWFDKEGDFLDVFFADAPGYLRLVSEADDVYERVDEQGRLLGFAIFNVSKRGDTPLEVALAADMLSPS